MNNKVIRKILSVAACITMLGASNNSAYSQDVTINKTATADGNNKTLTNLELSPLGSPLEKYTWVSGDADSVNAILSGGTLTVENYTSSVVNGVLKATSGTINVNNGTLTIDANSYILDEVTTNLDAAATLNVKGGQVTFGVGDILSGAINIASGTADFNNITLENGLTQQGGDSTLNYSTIIGNLGVSGGNINVSSGTINGNINQNNGNSNFTNTSVNGNTTVSNGNFEFSGGSISGNFTQNNGTSSFTNTNVKGQTTLTNGSLDFYDSTITGGIEQTGGDLYIDSSNINGNISMNGGTNITTDSTLNGHVLHTGGELYLNNTSKSSSSQFVQSGGSLNVTGTGFDLNNGGDMISGGDLDIGYGSEPTVMGVSQGTITANTNVNISQNSTMNISGGNVSLDGNDSWNGTVNVTGGSLALVGINKNSSGIYTQTSGSTTVTGEGFNLNNSSDNVSGGILNIGDNQNTGSINVSKGTIQKDAEVNLNQNSSLTISGGNVTLDGATDNWSGDVSISKGTLNIDGITKDSNATFTQTGGTTNITGSGFKINESDSVTEGTLNIGTATTTGSLKVNGGTIGEDATVNISSNGTVNLSKGNVTMDSEDSWAGTLNMTGGELNIKNANKTGTLTQIDGTINVTGKKFDLNNSKDLLDGGTINIGDGNTAASLNVSQGTITADETVILNNKATLNQSGGNVTLNSDDTWAGNINMTGGSLALVGINKTGTLTQTNGIINVTGSKFDLNHEDDYIKGGQLTIGNGLNDASMSVSKGAISKDTNINISHNANLNVNGGHVEMGSGTKWNGQVNISSGELELDNVSKGLDGTFKQTSGITTVTGKGLDLDNSEDIISGGTLNIGNKTTESELSVSQGLIESNATVNINRKGKLNVSGGEVNLDKNDSWHGDINISDGTLNLSDINKSAAGKFTQSGGKTTVTGELFELNNSEDRISGGTFNIGDGTNSSTVDVSQGTIDQQAKVNLNTGSVLNISGGNATLDNTDTWNGNVNVSGGSLALVGINNKNGNFTQTKGTTTVTETGLDLNSAEDKITGGTLNIGDGNTVSDLSVSQGLIGANTTVNIKNNATVKVTGGEVNLNKNSTWEGNVNISDGTLNIDSVSKNPQGNFAQSGGTTTVTGSGFDLNNASDSVAGGTFNVGNGTNVTEVGISKGTIAANATTNINSNATLNISGGKVNLDENDTYNGTINISSGSLALVGIKKNSDAILTQSGGTTTIGGTTVDLNNSSDNISAGTLNIGTDDEASSLNVSKGTIEENANVNIASGSSLNIKGGNVTLDGATDKFDGNVNVSNGNLNLNNITKNSSGVYNQTGGTTNVSGKVNVLNNDNDTISEGTVNIGENIPNSEFVMDKGTITNNAVVNVHNGSSFNMNNGTITSKAGVILKDTSILNVSGGEISKDSSILISENSTLNVKGGTVNLDGKTDKTDGSINVTDGTLNISDKVNKTTTSQGKFNQSAGTTNIDNSKLVLNTPDSIITGGTVNLTNQSELEINNSSENTSELNSTNSKFTVRKGSKYTTTAGTVDEDSTVNIEENATLEINGTNANVTLDGKTDTFKGHGKLTNGTLNIKNGLRKTTAETGTYNQTGGTANISDSSSLTLNEANSTISGGEVNVSADSELNINNGQHHTSRLNVSGSKFGIRNRSQYTTTGGTIDSDAAITVESGSKFKINGDDADVTFNGTNDKINGNIELNQGNLYISDDLTKVTDANGTYVQTGGNLTMSKSSLILADPDSKITSGNINLTDRSTLTVTQNGNSAFTGGNVVIDDTSVLNYLAAKGLVQADGNAINIDTSGLINMVNNVRTNSVINNLTVNNGEFGNGQANFAIDIHARSNSENDSDTITANSITAATKDSPATIHISDYNLGGDILGYDAPIDKHIRLGKIFKTDDLDNEITFSATDKEVFTPIGYYKLNPSAANDGSYTFDLSRFNPQVFRGQVATAASYMNQLVVNDTLFNRAQIRRYGSSYDEAFKNKSAILDGNASFERTLRDGQIWTEMFGNFETLKLSHNLDKVRNNSWGFIVGGDFGLKELRNGWRWMPTAYLAYNGGHQTFNKVGIYENGGQVGFMGSFMKDNFMETALAYVGVYGTDMSVAGTSEDAFNYFLGVASKTAYDWNLNSHFKVQPSLTLAYNMFGQQNWHSDYGQMGMSSGFLNGFNVAPSVNFILQQETWNMYATISYAWNFFGGMDGRAGNVDLPSVKMSQGYLQYGFGMQKAFSDRFNMYAQATIRNIGRTGVICQGGMNWRL